MYPYYFKFLRTILGKAAREGPINFYVKRAYKSLIRLCLLPVLTNQSVKIVRDPCTL